MNKSTQYNQQKEPKQCKSEVEDIYIYIKFLQICKEYDVTPNGLIIKKSPNIFPVSPSFTQDWKSIIKKSENQLTGKILQESESSLNLKLEEFHGNLTYYLKNHNDISNIQKLLTACTELEDKLFNRRIVKYLCRYAVLYH